MNYPSQQKAHFAHKSDQSMESRTGALTIEFSGLSIAFALDPSPTLIATTPVLPAPQTERAHFGHAAPQWDHALRTQKDHYPLGSAFSKPVPRFAHTDHLQLSGVKPRYALTPLRAISKQSLHLRMRRFQNLYSLIRD